MNVELGGASLRISIFIDDFVIVVARRRLCRAVMSREVGENFCEPKCVILAVIFGKTMAACVLRYTL